MRGYFSTYRGQPVYLAKINASTGDLETTFTDETDANNYVIALAMSGSSLYVGGGGLTLYRGTSVLYLIKVDTTTGALDTAFSQDRAGVITYDSVYALAF